MEVKTTERKALQQTLNNFAEHVKSGQQRIVDHGILELDLLVIKYTMEFNTDGVSFINFMLHRFTNQYFWYLSINLHDFR
jgi:hypothetical protein